MPYRIPQTMVAALVALAGSSTALAQTVQADLHGYQEVPVVSTAATGSLKAKIDADAGMIHWELTYEGLQGTVAQAHIHLGQTSVNGGIAVWLCTTPAITAPAGTQICPGASGTLSGTIMASNVVGPPAGGPQPQQLLAGESELWMLA